MTKPEQSKPAGELPPRTYGAPTCFSAVDTMRDCVADDFGELLGGAEAHPATVTITITPMSRESERRRRYADLIADR